MRVGKAPVLSDWQKRAMPGCNCLLDVILFKAIDLASQSCQTPDSIVFLCC